MFETFAPLLADTPWAINPAVLQGMLATRLDLIPEAATPQRGSSPPPRSGVAVIPIRGSINQHSGGDLFSLLFGGATTDGIAAEFRAAMADESVRAIVLDIDSPGGTAYGVSELSAEIHRARGRKPIAAVANSMAASAAYWLGSSADEFYITPGGMAGSIGVYVTHLDLSAAAEKEGVKPTLISAGKYKVEGNEFAPLDDEARTAAQHLVDSYYDTFVHDVARNRGTTESSVRNGYGEGRVLTAKDAVKAGLVDGVRTYEQVLARIGETRTRGGVEAAVASASATIDRVLADRTFSTSSSVHLDFSGAQWQQPTTTFLEQAEAVASTVTEFVARLKRRSDFRAGEGRALGATNRQQVESVIAELKAATHEAEQVLAEHPDPEAQARRDHFARLQMEMLSEQLADDLRVLGATA